jgi:glycosyltransferase involved in cell wall biosynthesis
VKIFIVHPSELLTDNRADGDGLLAYRTICELASRGHEISIACQEIDIRLPTPANVYLYPIKPQKIKLLERIGFALSMRRLFVQLSEKTHFDIAHQLNPVNPGLSLGLVGIGVPLILGPYVSNWPSVRPSRLKSTLLNAINALQQHFADAIVLSSASARSRIVHSRLPADRIVTIPYGIDLAAFPERPFPAGEPSILFLAGFARRKGLLVLLEAFDLVAARVPNVQLTVAGGGIERDEILETVAKSPYHDRIRFVGVVPREAVSKTIGACTVFCSPSFGEPYGMNLVEAMATGRPVVATASGGPLDILDERGGKLVPVADVRAMAEALETIILDPLLARRMGSFNRRAVHDHSWDTVVTRLEALYAHVLCQVGCSRTADP